MEPPESNAVVVSSAKQSHRDYKNNKENDNSMSNPGSSLQIKKKQTSTKSKDKISVMVSSETPYKNVAYDPGSKETENDYADERFDEVPEIREDRSPNSYRKNGVSPPAALSRQS